MVKQKIYGRLARATALAAALYAPSAYASTHSARADAAKAQFEQRLDEDGLGYDSNNEWHKSEQEKVERIREKRRAPTRRVIPPPDVSDLEIPQIPKGAMWLGLAALGAGYILTASLKGLYPFVEVPDNEYRPLATAWEKPAGKFVPYLGVLKGPGTPLFLRPFYKYHHGTCLSIPSNLIERPPRQSIPFRTADGGGGELLGVQLILQVPSREAAIRFYWNTPNKKGTTLEEKLSYADEKVYQRIIHKLGTLADPSLVPGGDYLTEIVNEIKGEVEDETGEFGEIGTLVKRINVSGIRFDPATEAYLTQVPRAVKLGLARQALAEANAAAMTTYLDTARASLGTGASDEAILKLALAFKDSADNTANLQAAVGAGGPVNISLITNGIPIKPVQ